MDLKVERLPDGSARYTTIDGDMVDQICWLHYGREWETTEAVYVANAGLAARGPVLPAGVVIRLPLIAAPTASRRDTIRLFD
ncbi:tail protein X [Methylobacterium hispanicum]|uniref:tail protein X n=1 Tax=Methylobacterium hispanicum TaxID=270350 RepID=UPI002F2BD2C5